MTSPSWLLLSYFWLRFRCREDQPYQRAMAGFWAELFSRHDFEVFDVLRPRIWNIQRVARWYRQNALLYCHRDFVRHFPGLSATPSTFPLAVVHRSNTSAARMKLIPGRRYKLQAEPLVARSSDGSIECNVTNWLIDDRKSWSFSAAGFAAKVYGRPVVGLAGRVRPVSHSADWPLDLPGL